MSIKASIRSAGTKITANTVGIIPVLNGNTTLNGNLTIADGFTLDGTIGTAAQPNITSLGTLKTLTVATDGSSNGKVIADALTVNAFNVAESGGGISYNGNAFSCDVAGQFSANHSVTAPNGFFTGTVSTSSISSTADSAGLIIKGKDAPFAGPGGKVVIKGGLGGESEDVDGNIEIGLTSTNLVDLGPTRASSLQVTGNIESPMTTGAITVTRGGETYANAPRVDLIDSDGTNQRCSFINSGGNLQLEARNGSTKGIISFLQNADGVRTTAFKVSSGGNVGVNITNPQEKLHVDGNGRIDGNFYADVGSNTFTVRADTNNVGVGTGDPPASYKFVVAGDSRFTGSGIFGATATGGNKGLQKHYAYSDAGAFRLYRTNSATNSITMKYQSSTSNEFLITQTGSSSDVIKFQTDTTKFISNVEVGSNGNAKALIIKDSRDSTDGIRFAHTGVNDEVQMGMYGSYGQVDQGRFKITHKNSNDANTVILEIEKNGTDITIAKPTKITQQLNLGNVPVHADNAAATTAGLVVGDVYRTSTGVLMIRF